MASTQFALASIVLLAACSQPSAPAPPQAPTPVGAVPSAPSPAALVTPQIAKQIAAMPAPFNQADYTNGRRLFAQCRSCHQTDPNAGPSVGPNLHGVFARKAGSLPGFNYSSVMKHAGWTWNYDKLDEWIKNPQQMLPGTRMTFAGLPDPNARRDVIAYLKIESEK